MRPGWATAAVMIGSFGMVLSACAGILGVPPDPLDGTSWVLVSLEERAALPGTELTAEFEAGFVGGSSGCNNYGGSYRLDGDRIEIRELQATLMACVAPEGAMDQEQTFLRLLSEAENYQLADGQLRLMLADQVLLAFVPVN